LQVFHAGTAVRNGELVTDGGRVLSVCALGDSLESARERAYGAVQRIEFRGKHVRTDIGSR
ncbi:MAG: phosphoribosylamine--glycine ligase, partial [Planctomycetes bacterium]|nr:phosphoribosylamine--glycine ligase [Planctomycetota bacterium]